MNQLMEKNDIKIRLRFEEDENGPVVRYRLNKPILSAGKEIQEITFVQPTTQMLSTIKWLVDPSNGNIDFTAVHAWMVALGRSDEGNKIQPSAYMDIEPSEFFTLSNALSNFFCGVILH